MPVLHSSRSESNLQVAYFRNPQTKVCTLNCLFFALEMDRQECLSYTQAVQSPTFRLRTFKTSKLKFVLLTACFFALEMDRQECLSYLFGGSLLLPSSASR